MHKVIIAAALLSLTATSVSAEMLTCRQSKLSASGFSSIAAAQSWFPKAFKIAIKGEEAISDVYGKGTVTTSKGRKHIKFVTATADGKRTSINVTFIERTKRYPPVLPVARAICRHPARRANARSPDASGRQAGLPHGKELLTPVGDQFLARQMRQLFQDVANAQAQPT